MNWMLSYPRSGNHLARVWLEALTGIPTGSHYLGDAHPMGPAPPGTPRDDTATPVFTKIHRFAHLKGGIDRTARLLLILRHPLDCIASDARDIPPFMRPFYWPWEAHKYLANCSDFLDWEGPKLVLYYEDMVSEPERAIEALGTFVLASAESIDKCCKGADELAHHALGQLRRAPLSRRPVHSPARSPLFLLAAHALIPQRTRHLLEPYTRPRPT